jgi:predicted acyl esterase
MTEAMTIDWDVAVPMDDGVTMSANVYRPSVPGHYPVIMSYGPYGKDLSFQRAYAPRWRILEENYPDAVEGSSNIHQSWELVDPEKWVPHGYVVVRVDSRGAGRSPGVVDPWSPREARDYHDCIEWAAAQPWSNGRVGLAGVSYYAMNSWQVAALNPPHLAAVVSWEGCSDLYREAAYHGGIHNDFLGGWFPRQVESVQYGAPSEATNPASGLRVTGDERLTPEQLEANRVDFGRDILDHPLLDEYWSERSADISQVRVPILSAGNWGGHGLHLRGNIEGYLGAASPQKWLELHGREHWSMFYTEYGRELHKRFFDHFLKGEGDWLQSQPPVSLHIRQPDDSFVQRDEQEWPLARTEYRRSYLDSATMRLRDDAQESAEVSYRPLEQGVTFTMPPFDHDVELTGPISATLWMSSQSTDADLFLVLRAFDPEGRELLFRGAGDPFAPLAQGWLRASHRALDAERSTPWRPVHPHDRVEPLVPGEAYELQIEIWPTCIALPAGYSLALSVLGRDYDHGLGEAELATRLGWSAMQTRGSGPYVHEVGRPAEIFGAPVTIYTGGERASFVTLPFIPTEGAL